MEGAKKNPDKLYTVAIVTVGAVGCALVYLSIVGLQSFYVNETAAVDEQAKFGDQDKLRTNLRSQQIGKITEPRRMGWAATDGTQAISIHIDEAKKLAAHAQSGAFHPCRSRFAAGGCRVGGDGGERGGGQDG